MKIIIFLIFILFPGYCLSANSAISDKIQEFYQNTPSFTADFIQLLEHKESGTKEKRTGSLLFRKPMDVNWHSNKPDEEILLLNKKEIWNYLPDEQIAYKYSPSLVNQSQGLIQVLTGQAKLKNNFEIKEIGEERGLKKLLLYPHEPGMELVEAVLWVNNKTGQIQRAKIIDFYGNINDVSLANFNNSPKLQDSDFQFIPSGEIEIEDRSNDSSIQKKLF